MFRIVSKKDLDFLIDTYHNYRRLKLEIDLLSYHNKKEHPLLEDVEEYFKNFDGERLNPETFKKENNIEKDTLRDSNNDRKFCD